MINVIYGRGLLVAQLLDIIPVGSKWAERSATGMKENRDQKARNQTSEAASLRENKT